MELVCVENDFNYNSNNKQKLDYNTFNPELIKLSNHHVRDFDPFELFILIAITPDKQLNNLWKYTNEYQCTKESIENLTEVLYPDEHLIDLRKKYASFTIEQPIATLITPKRKRYETKAVVNLIDSVTACVDRSIIKCLNYDSFIRLEETACLLTPMNLNPDLMKEDRKSFIETPYLEHLFIPVFVPKYGYTLGNLNQIKQFSIESNNNPKSLLNDILTIDFPFMRKNCFPCNL